MDRQYLDDLHPNVRANFDADEAYKVRHEAFLKKSDTERMALSTNSLKSAKT